MARKTSRYSAAMASASIASRSPSAEPAAGAVAYGAQGAVTADRHRHLSQPSNSDRQSAAARSVQPVGRGFLFSPAIDLLFIANLYWPLLLFVDFFGGVSMHESLLFWQIYFITAPHRWITLLLVATDRQRTGGRGLTFAMLAIGILVACLCLKFGTGSLLCLGVIDYIWNAWHFSSQHHGIFRIYQRKSPTLTDPALTSPARLRMEKVVFRVFLLYVIARVAGWGWTEGPFSGSQWVAGLDWFWLAIPIFFIMRQAVRTMRDPDTAVAAMAYLTSVMTLFSAMLMAAHFEKSQLVIQLALASAVFHSLEYMSIVSWATRSAKPQSATNMFARLARIWVLFLAIFVIVIGAGNYLLSRGMFDLWVLINLVVAFWHYCFDGMIWKSPKPKPAATMTSLGVAK